MSRSAPNPEAREAVERWKGIRTPSGHSRASSRWTNVSAEWGWLQGITAAILASVSQMTQERPWSNRPASRDGRRVRVSRQRSRTWLRRLFVAAVIVAASGLLALAIADARFRPLLLPPVALAGLWAVGHFQFAAACGVIALGASIVEPSTLKMPVGPLDLRLTEMLLGALLLVAFVRPRRQWWGGAAGAALAIFFAVLSVSAIAAVASGRAHPVDAYHYSRSLAPALMFFVVVRLFPEPGQVQRLLYAAVALATLTGVVSVLAAAPGSTITEFLNPSGTSNGVAPPPSQTTGMGLVDRVRLPGVALAYVLFWYAALHAMRAAGTTRVLWAAAVIGTGLAIALSFNRNMWLGVSLGVVMVFVISHARARRQIAAGVLVLVVVGTLFTLSGARIPSDSPVYPIVARFTTLFQPGEEIQDSSLTDRFWENRYAIDAIGKNPIIGVGPGAPYGLTAITNLGNRVFLRNDALFLHNQYLHLLLIGGPLALLSFVTFLLAPVISGVRRLRHDDTFVALAVGLATTLMSSIVMIAFVHATFSLVLGVLVGALAVLVSHAGRGASGDQVAA